jgi:hypothetical protein
MNNNEELEKFAGLLHDTFCKEDHEFSTKCNFYDEETLSIHYEEEDLWSQPHHNKWLECAKEMNENGITREKLELIFTILKKYDL